MLETPWDDVKDWDPDTAWETQMGFFAPGSYLAKPGIGDHGKFPLSHECLHTEN